MRYNPALEGLRAVAIIFVVCHQVVMAPFPGFWIGVDVFFFAADNQALAILNYALSAGPERLPRNSRTLGLTGKIVVGLRSGALDILISCRFIKKQLAHDMLIDCSSNWRSDASTSSQDSSGQNPCATTLRWTACAPSLFCL
jgi:hypothetical protein